MKLAAAGIGDIRIGDSLSSTLTELGLNLAARIGVELVEPALEHIARLLPFSNGQKADIPSAIGTAMQRVHEIAAPKDPLLARDGQDHGPSRRDRRRAPSYLLSNPEMARKVEDAPREGERRSCSQMAERAILASSFRIGAVSEAFNSADAIHIASPEIERRLEAGLTAPTLTDGHRYDPQDLVCTSFKACQIDRDFQFNLAEPNALLTASPLMPQPQFAPSFSL